MAYELHIWFTNAEQPEDHEILVGLGKRIAARMPHLDFDVIEVPIEKPETGL